MTPLTRSALDVLVGSTISDETAAEVDALGTDYAGIAELLSIGRTHVAPTLMTERGVISTLGSVAGVEFLEALEAFVVATLPDGHPLKPHQKAVGRAVGWLKHDGIDVGDTLTRTLLDGMVAAGVLQGTSVTAVKARAVKPNPLTEVEVAAAMTADAGPTQTVVLVADQPCANERHLAVQSGGTFGPYDLVAVYRSDDASKTATGALPAYYIAFGVFA